MLELGGGVCVEAEFFGRGELTAEDRARRDTHVIVRLLVPEIAQNERRLLQPARDAQRLEVRHEMEVAIPQLPVREAVTGDRLHLHIGGEKVIASVRAFLHDVIQEHAGIETLAKKPAVVIREAHHHRFDLATLDTVAQLVRFQHALNGGRVLAQRVSSRERCRSSLIR